MSGFIVVYKLLLEIFGRIKSFACRLPLYFGRETVEAASIDVIFTRLQLCKASPGASKTNLREIGNRVLRLVTFLRLFSKHDLCQH